MFFLGPTRKEHNRCICDKGTSSWSLDSREFIYEQVRVLADTTFEPYILWLVPTTTSSHYLYYLIGTTKNNWTVSKLENYLSPNGLLLKI